MTEQPQVVQPELSNQQPLALGKNLNQIAKVLNTAPQNRTAFRVEVITEPSGVIQAHTKKVSDVLRGMLASPMTPPPSQIAEQLDEWGSRLFNILMETIPRPRRIKHVRLSSDKSVSSGGRLGT